MLKPIPGFPHYMACSDGRVFSLYSMDWMIPAFDKATGYLNLSVCENKVVRVVKMHRLIALAFHEKPKGKYVVNHKDEDKTNNRAENLEWVTYSDNTAYGTSRQRAVETAGIENLRKSAERARHIRDKAHERPVINLNTGVLYPSIKDAAVKTGVRRTGIWGCCNGRQKTCGGSRWEYAEVS